MRYFIIILSFSILTSCSPRTVDYVECCDEVIQENRTNLIPIFNSSEQTTPWNVSDELTQMMKEMKCKNTHFTVNETARWMNFDEACQGMSVDIQADFVVVADLIQHSVIPFEVQMNNSSMLLMKVHLVIFDLRHYEPRVIFDQIVSTTHSIPSKYAFWNYSKNTPGSYHYEETPMSQAHVSLATILIEKIQEHVN